MRQLRYTAIVFTLFVRFASAQEPPCIPEIPCDAAGDGCDSISGSANACSLADQLFGDCEGDCWLTSDKLLLQSLRNQKTWHDDVTYSVGGALRYRYIDERNRLRPPLAAGRSSYDQYRFTPFVELGYKDLVKGYVQAIDAPTFNNELPQLIIDENRADLLQYYVDLQLLDVDSGKVRFRYGRQFLQYGSQHLVSPLAWANTYRNFEGYKLYYTSEDWDIDAFAVQPVNGAALSDYQPQSFDTPDQSKWFNGVYTTYKKAKHGTLDLYWLWLYEQEDKVAVLDGNRHTIGTRYAGAIPVKNGDKVSHTWSWDVEGGWQFGEEDYVTGLNQEISAGFLSLLGGITMNELPWTPKLEGIFWWGSGDKNPGDGRSTTVNTLFPLGHAYWGQLDQFSGQNLVDYGVHLTVKPTKKLTLLGGWHWFDKAQNQDAIYNIAGVPFGGVTTTDSNIGNEVDLIATYQMNKNLQLQLGYFWFWYGDAVNNNPNALVANRDAAEQVYFLVDWAF